MKRLYILFFFILNIWIGICNAFEDLRWEDSVQSNEYVNTTSSLQSKKISFNTSSVDNKNAPVCDNPEEKSLYEAEKEKKTLDILKESPTPLRTSDTILRILMLPYTDNNDVLHSYYYAFIKVEDGKWVIGDYLNNTSNKQKMILHHIDNPLDVSNTDTKINEARNPSKSPMPAISSHENVIDGSSFEEEGKK